MRAVLVFMMLVRVGERLLVVMRLFLQRAKVIPCSYCHVPLQFFPWGSAVSWSRLRRFGKENILSASNQPKAVKI